MKKILIILMLLSIKNISAQTYKGKIIDENSKPMEFVTVALYSLPDSVLVVGQITDSKGEFSLNAVNANKAFLKISFVGYESQTVLVNNNQIITLKPQNLQLSGVVVQGKRKAFQIQKGNIIANISGTALAKEASPMEILRHMPGMTLKDGVLTSFIGGNPIIYINGKKVKSMDEVKQLEVKNIKTVELNTNPGAEYDASTGAVLLITTNKRMEGLAIQIESLIRKNNFWSHDNAIKINYKQKNIALFAQIGYSDYQRKTNQNVTTLIYTPDTIWKSHTLLSDKINSYKELPFSIGVDYTISEKHSLGFKYDGIWSKNNLENLQPLTLWKNENIYTELEGKSSKNNKNITHYINGYYRGVLTEKLQMDIFADFLKKTSDGSQIVNENSQKYGARETNIQTCSDNKLFAITPRLYYSLSPQHKFTVGTEFNKVSVNTTLNYNPKSTNDTHSETSEIKGAGFLDYSFNNKKGLALSVGLRYEWVHFVFDDYLNAKNKIDRTFSNLFPSAQISYQTGSLSQTLSYRSGITRPSYGELNGDTFYINQFMYQEGNPRLVPEISHNIQYSLMYKFVYLALQYQYIQNSIQNYLETSSSNSNVVKSTYANYDKAQKIQAVLNLRHTFSFYTPSLTVAYMQNFINVPSNNIAKQVSKPFLYLNFDNNFSFSHGWTFNIEYTYTGEGTSGFLYFKPTHVFSTRIQKTFMDEKLQINLSANDIFGKSITRYTGQVNNISMSGIDNQDRRAVSLSLTWRFNNYKKSYKGKSAAQDEMNRIK